MCRLVPKANTKAMRLRLCPAAFHPGIDALGATSQFQRSSSHSAGKYQFALEGYVLGVFPFWFGMLFPCFSSASFLFCFPLLLRFSAFLFLCFSVAIEIPFYLEIDDQYTFQKAEQMLNFFAASALATEARLLKDLEQKLEELCFTVLPDLRPMRCTAPKKILIGPATRVMLYLPPAEMTTPAPTTTTEVKIIIEVNLQEGLPAWAVALLIAFAVTVGFCGSYIYRLRQQKKKLLRRGDLQHDGSNPIKMILNDSE
eukprot:s860_g10.t1